MVLPSPKASGANGAVNRCLLLLVVGMGVVIVVLTLQLRGMDSQMSDSLIKQTKTATGVVDCVDRTRQQLLRASDSAAGAGLVSRSTVEQSPQQGDFLALAEKYATDKIGGQVNWNKQEFQYADAKNPKCRVWGHFYNTMYQKWLGPYSVAKTPEFQFLEIGFSGGAGFASFVDFLPKAEHHSIEYECEFFKRQDDKPWHAPYTQQGRFHCGDSSNFDFLLDTYQKMQQPKDGRVAPPPLTVVVEDASHVSQHQAAAVFFWFPRLEPGGLMIIEDVQPNGLSNQFRHEFLPQIMWDLHYCGDPNPIWPLDDVCFPTLQPLLKSVHCEMHICVLERNEVPASKTLSREDSVPPPNALNMDLCREKKRKATRPPGFQ